MEYPSEHQALFVGEIRLNGQRCASKSDEKKSIEKCGGRGWTKLLILAGFSTTIGSSLPVGYNIGVVNSPAQILKRFCNESMFEHYGFEMSPNQLELLWSAVVSIFLVGGTVGSLTGSWLADKMGRKRGLIVASFLLTFSGILFLTCKAALSVEMLILGRFIVGLAAGSITCIMPMYLTELAPIDLRGAVGVLCPLGVTSGVLLAQVISLRNVLGTEIMWPVLLSFFLVMVIISSLIIPFLPESPKYLFVIKNNRNLALNSLEKIRNKKICDLEEEVTELEVELADVKKQKTAVGFCGVLCDRTLLLPLLLVCSMQGGQQFSGINAVFYYSKSIFQNAGLSESNSEFATVAAGAVNLGMAIASIYIMSNFKRRSVFQLSTSLSALFLILLGVAITYMTTVSWMPYISIVAVLGYVFAYGIGLGPIPYFIGSELFEVGPRPTAMALGSMANWGGNFIIGMTFPLMQSTIGPASFYIFAVTTFLLFLFTRLYLPETKDRDPIDVAQALRKGFGPRPLASPVGSSATDETFASDDLK
nr:solute carrier family 2, facilitated glucose transporter member 1-like [Onthophagus taurus]